MISYICLLATVFANLSCADDMDNSKFDNMIPYGKQEVSYTYPKGEGNLRVLTFNIRHCAGNDDVINYDRTAAVINGMEPDVVCLQEVDYKTGDVKVEIDVYNNKASAPHYQGHIIDLKQAFAK